MSLTKIHDVEYVSDGDMVTADVATHVPDLPTMLRHPWSPAAPAQFV